MKYKLISMLFLFFVGYPVFAQDEIIGKWKNKDNGMVIQIYEQDKTQIFVRIN